MHLFFIPATKNNTGITLVEILIGIVVSGIIVASMYGSFQVVNNTFQNSNAQSGVNQNFRRAILMLSQDIKKAGYSDYGQETQRLPTDVPLRIFDDEDGNQSIEIIYQANGNSYRTTYSVNGHSRVSPALVGTRELTKRVNQWSTANNSWGAASANNDRTFDFEIVLPFISTLEFDLANQNGQLSPSPTPANPQDFMAGNFGTVTIVIGQTLINNPNNEIISATTVLLKNLNQW